MPTTYPSLTDVQAYATAAGVTINATQGTNALAATIAEWERRTKFKPFLADASDTTEYFDAGGEWSLALPGYYSITSVYTGITATESGGTVTLSAGTRSYNNVGHLERREWFDAGAPITWLEWKTLPACGMRSVKVTGRRGAFANIPDDVWLGLVEAAGDRAIQIANEATRGGVAEYEIGRGDERIKYASAATAQAATQSRFDALVKRYRKAAL